MALTTAADLPPATRWRDEGCPAHTMLTEATLQRLARLTPKERACLLLVAQRASSKAIAAELGIAKTSVDTYCNRARQKLEVADRYEAARLVVAQAQLDRPGAGNPPDPDPLPMAELAPPARVLSDWAFLGIVVLISGLAVASLASGMAAFQQLRAPHATPTAPAARHPAPAP